ncbi:protein downstream neighbor of son homolog isoform X2 [Anguilla rostrata]|uniref:protein downstream neighbor of son homolog isoform X2 n=1 Tax=Anguilla anguilla TaxID=7936 RepID=UPI0015B1E5C6|nr:protein downstream neighbor of son homolog isoform X2 [Anguilla anguilla]
MSEQAGYSPSFKRPSDILRLRKKRARSEGVGSGGRNSSASPGLSVPGVRPFSPGSLLNGPPRPGGVKRRNPFANLENTYNSPKKRAVVRSEGDAYSLGCKPLIIEAEVENQAEGPARRDTQQFTERLLHAEKRYQEAPDKKQTSVSEDDSLFEDDLFADEKISPPILTSPLGHGSGEMAPHVCVEYPADWSLKTRLLFTSPLSFSWAEQLKAGEEAQGLTQHCRATHVPLPQNIQEPRCSVELRCSFQQALQYWQHPSLPWLPLFPRIAAERRFSGKSAPWAHDPALQQSLMSEWAVSFTSLYSLLKARLCPFFYLCSYQFTALFRTSGLSGTSAITAVLSPTTRGLREAMRAEGIDFTLPLVEEKKKCKNPRSTAHQTGEHGAEPKELAEEEDDEEYGEEEEDDEDGGFSWLKEMGVQDKIKKPDSISIKLRKEHSEVKLDHRPESLVLVQGSSTFTLLNFLINCKSLVAAAGSQAGLPPTLLAPNPFRGATLHVLKARSVKVKTQVRTGYQDVSSLEVTGPVMPHALHALTRLLRPAQRGGFSAGLYPHEPTAVFNTPVGPPAEPHLQDTAAQDLEGCGLHPSTVRQLVQPSTLGKSTLRHLHMKEYSYTWSL